MPPKKGKGRAKRSQPDAEEVAAEGQVNVHVDIHPAPPEEDTPAEAVPPPDSCDWSYNQSWQCAIGRTISRGNQRLVGQFQGKLKTHKGAKEPLF